MKKLYLIAVITALFVFIIPAIANAFPNIYQVKAGDTLPQIAKKFHTTEHDLKLTNGLQSNSLVEGKKLWVPVTHEVGADETIDQLATTYHSTPEIITSANQITAKSLQPGQVLTIKPRNMSMNGQHILMTREEFRDWLLHQKLTRKVKLIQQHHTWKPSYKNFHGNNHFQMLESMQHHHMKTMGWSNIAQNITTFPDGKVAVSRPLNTPPEGTIGPEANQFGIAIENIGDFDLGHDVMTKEQKETIVYITALLSLKFNLEPSIDTITYHHWWHYKTKKRVLDNAKSNEVKSCPGTGFFGGNSTSSAKQYFYPLVKKKMDELRQYFE